LKNWLTHIEEAKDLEKLKTILIEKIGLVKDSEISDIVKKNLIIKYLSL